MQLVFARTRGFLQDEGVSELVSECVCVCVCVSACVRWAGYT